MWGHQTQSLESCLDRIVAGVGAGVSTGGHGCSEFRLRQESSQAWSHLFLTAVHVAGLIIFPEEANKAQNPSREP